MYEKLSATEKKLHRTRLDELKSNTAKIEYIMTHFPKTNANSNLLCYLFWMLVERARSLDDVNTLTKADSILRTRQIIVKRWKEEKR